MKSPYAGLPSRAFWRTAVSDAQGEYEALYRPKFRIAKETRVAAAGSCFAQHISRNLRERGYSVVDVEPAPPGLPKERHNDYGYGIYSARFGNIYTVRQLLQLVQESRGRFRPVDAVWRKEDRFYDALRPSVEPRGLGSAEAVLAHRADHLRRVAKMVGQTDVLVFTLGLTEAWTHGDSGTCYPTAPGTIAGDYDPGRYLFHNFKASEILADFYTLRSLLRRKRPDLRFLLTVSPVPLTATASDDHVLAATTYSKSVLRAVAGEISKECEDVDYFPSYEIIASPPSKGAYYEENMRSVTAAGVARVMGFFFGANGEQKAGGKVAPKAEKAAKNRDGRAERAARKKADVVCEDALLEAFAQ